LDEIYGDLGHTLLDIVFEVERYYLFILLTSSYFFLPLLASFCLFVLDQLIEPYKMMMLIMIWKILLKDH
jgi:hypothetical protein